MRILATKDRYLEQSGYLFALRLEKFFSSSSTLTTLFVSGLGALLFLFLAVVFAKGKLFFWPFLGAAEIFLSIFLTALIYFLFLRDLREDKKLSIEEVKKAYEQEAYGRILTLFAAQIIDQSAAGENLLLPKTFDFLLADKRFVWVLKRLNINPKEFGLKVQEAYPPAAAWPLSEVLQKTWQKALSANHLEVRYSDMLVALFEIDKIFQKIMFDYEAAEEDVQTVVYWQRRHELKKRTKFWDEENLLDTKGIGKHWSGGFTINLDKVARDVTESVRLHQVPFHLFGREAEVELLGRMLIRAASASNVVLVGPPGIGRHTILSALASRISSGRIFAPLKYLRLLEINATAVVSGTVSLNEVVDKINLLFGEADLAENVILVVTDLDAFFDPHPEAGRVNATEALLPFLKSRLKIIGTTTPLGYQATIGKNPELLRLISKLEISELSPAQTLMILQDAVQGIEGQDGLFFTHKALKEIVKLATKLIQNLPNPEKSLEILEETAIFVLTKAKTNLVLAEDVQKVVTMRTKVPVEKLAREEKEVLLHLEEILHERIINQHEAIRELSDALRRARAGVASEKKPIGSFLFLGPTGVGKTETTKALAAIYFGSEQKIIRFDMSEFQEIHAINRLIGDADAGGHGGLLTESVLANPFSLILLDELEKAHPKILDLFLQVLDEGRLTDALGRTVSFVNTMIVATSNAGAELIREMVVGGRNPSEARQEIMDKLLRQGLFRPEFLNRFDAVIVFRPLSRQELTEVAVLLLRELNERLAEKDIAIKITPELAAWVVKGGYSPEFGARPLRRFIQEHIENYVARGLLAGEIKRGQVVEIRPDVL